MEVKNTKGFSIGMYAGSYELLKFAFNFFVMKGSFDVVTMLIGIAAILLSLSGLKFGNYVIAGLVAAIAIMYLPGNISNIGSNWVYLIEGIIDLVTAVILCLNSDVKEHFSNDISEIGK